MSDRGQRDPFPPRCWMRGPAPRDLGTTLRDSLSKWLPVLVVAAVTAGCSAYDSPRVQVPDEIVTTKVALIDFFPTLGELEPNVEALALWVEEAFAAGARIVVTPELATTGYAITSEQVTHGLGLENPFPQLAGLGDLAKRHGGYLFIGIAEIGRDTTAAEALYNSVVIYGPEGLIGVQRKRGVAEWNVRGNLPFDVVATPYGDLAAVICSDSYLQDWIRIATLHGADVVVAPANWWGETGQVGIWQTRAQENGVWMAVANRWGTEEDRRYDPPYTAHMNDAPTVVISPAGEVRLLYRPDQTPEPRDKILYYDVEVPRDRIGTTANPTYSVAHRRPSAYSAVANEYYLRDQGNLPMPGLPPPGSVAVAAVSYVPSPSPTANLDTVARLLGEQASAPEVVALPGLGVRAEPLACTDSWASEPPWPSLQSYVDTNGIALLVTTVYTSCPRRLALAIFQAGEPAQLRGQIHDAWGLPGSGEPPLYLDLQHARVGLLTGVDFLFPETATQLAKSGVDLIVVPSIVAAPAGEEQETEPGPVGWDAEDLVRTWKTRTGQCFHVVASDASGNGAIVRDGGCFALEVTATNAQVPVRILDLDSSKERNKLLNSYYRFDLQALLGATSSDGALSRRASAVATSGVSPQR